MRYSEDLEKIILTEEEIAKRVKELGEQISREYAGQELFVVCVLRGAVVFFSDLIRSITIPLHIDFIKASSYAGTESSGTVNVHMDVDNAIAGQNVIIVEDILDTGRTLCFLKQEFLKRGPKSVKICTLLDKPERRKADITADYVGYVVPDEFVVGYGLDYNEDYRHFPYIGVLKPEIYGGE